MITEYVVGAVAAAALLGAVYVKGRFDGARGPEQELEQMYAAARNQAEHYNEVLTKLRISHSEVMRQKKRVDDELRKVAARPEYQRQCFDGDGVRVVNDAIAAGAGRTAGEVCKADPVDGWTCGDSVAASGGDSP